MAFQSPLISIPRKTTSDVDWAGPIRTVISQSYGEDPSVYSEEISVLSRCRQDAVRGAGSDQTARDLLYKYFGQLELLELRFAEIKVAFPWNDAFTLKLTSQTSLAFEKASIIHLLSSVLSSLASATSRADPAGLKRAYFHSRASAGMLTYINDNFLHAPSTDLSREVVHFLISIMIAQATEVFTETLVEGKKAPGLVCRSANQVAGMYGVCVEEMKEFQGKGVFDRNWLYVLQVKAKLFGSLAQYYRAVADQAGGKHGHALVRLRLADGLAQEAQRQATSFSYSFVSSQTPTLPHDAASSLAEITKAHAALCAESKNQAGKDNDLIYHDILPSEAALPAIDKLPPAGPITIQEVYGNPEVSKLIGPDIFIRLVPLAVHESASIYSEEKAKVVRAEVERVDLSEGEIRAGLEHLGLPGVVSAWRRLTDDDEGGGAAEGDVEVSSSVRRLAQEVGADRGVGEGLRGLEREREACERELRELSGMLDAESRECERMRAKYTPQFTQPPSGPQTAHMRSTISSNLGSLSTSADSDSHLLQLWQSIQADVNLLSGGEEALQRIARDVAVGKAVSQMDKGVSLLDLQEDESSGSGLSEAEKEELRQAVDGAQEKLDRLGKIRRERDEVLKDLKDKIQNDDVSSLLLLNRRSQNVEPQLFSSELEKFRPYQGRLAAAVQASKSILQELEMLVRQVEKGKGVKERQRGQKERAKRVKEWERGLEQSGMSWHEIQAGLSKGQSYYGSLQGVIADVGAEVRRFTRDRENERNRMVGEIEMRQRISGGGGGGSSASAGLDARLAGLSLGSSGSTAYAPSPPPKPMSGYPSAATPSLPPPPPHTSTPAFPPPPPPQQPQRAASSSSSSSPYDFSSLNLPSAFSTASSSPPTSQPQYRPPAPQPPPRQSSYASPTYSSPPPASNPYPPPPPSRPTQQSAYPPPPPPQSHSQPQSYGYQPPPQNYAPPPPPPAQQPYSPPPQQQPQHQQSPYPPPPTSSRPYQPPQPPAPQQYQAYQPPQQQHQGYQSPPPQQHGYQSPAPPPQPPYGRAPQQQYGGYQPPAQGGQQQGYGGYRY